MGDLPLFSAYAFSGRGLYLFWRLHDNGEPLSSLNKVERYGAVNHALYASLRHLASDVNARDASRILRLPNSIHSKTGNRVTYHRASDRVYTLEELEHALGIIRTPVAIATRTSLPKPTIEKMQGIFALNRYRAAEILRVEKHVGGWSEGTRRPRLLVYAQCLRNSGCREKVALSLVQEMAQRCQPQLDGRTAAGVVGTAYRGKCYRRKAETLCKVFGVTSEMVDELGLTSFASAKIRERRLEARRAARAQRKATIERILRAGINSKPGLAARELSAECRGYGIQISPRQVNRIIKRLGNDW